MCSSDLMMSFAGGWFFATQSEAISVNNASYTLPGLGSYVATAIAQKRLDCVGWALLTMLVLIVLTDQFFWRPVVAWCRCSLMATLARRVM